MRLGIAGGVVLVLFFAATILGYSSLFTVYQTQQALVVRLGQPVGVVTEPGLHIKALADVFSALRGRVGKNGGKLLAAIARQLV